MPFSDNGGLQAMQARIAAIRAEITPTMQAAASEIGDMVVSDLADTAPIGRSGSDAVPIGDDAPGHIKDSFTALVEGGEGGGTVTVVTNQPNKLQLIVEGRGEVLPVTKKALFWPGLPHPVMRAGPVAPNDFVTPVKAKADAEVGPIMTDALDGLLGAL